MRALVCVVLAVNLLVGCTSESGRASEPAAAGPGSSALVATGVPTVVVAAGVRVELPPDAAKDGSTLSVDSVGVDQLGSVPAGVTPLQPIDVTLDGGVLQQPATIRFPLPSGLPTGSSGQPDPLVVMWQDPGGGWRLLPAERTAAGIVAQTDHFSIGFTATIDVDRWVRDRRDDVVNYFTGRSGVEQPSCGDEQAARANGVVVESDGGDAVKWCFGVEGGQRLLKIANNRRTFATVTYPESWKVQDGASLSISLDAAARVLGDVTSEWANIGNGRTARTISGGDTLTLVVGPEGSGRAQVSADGVAWAFSAIVFGMEVYSGVAAKLGVEQAKDTYTRFVTAVTKGGPALSYFDAGVNCVQAQLDQFGDYDKDADLDATLDKVLKYMWSCVPQLMTADLKAVGISMFGSGIVLQAIAGLVSSVLTATHLVVTGIREIVDSIASFGGESDVFYDIRISRPKPREALTLITQPHMVFARPRGELDVGTMYSGGLIARQDGDTLFIAWVSQFHRPCLVAQWNGEDFQGTVRDLVDKPARALPYRDPAGKVHLRVWSDTDNTLYTGSSEEDWVESTLDGVRASGAEMFDGTLAEFLADCR